MRLRSVLKVVGVVIGGIVALAVVLAIVGYFMFVPSAKEPPYEFVRAWGSEGSEPGQFRDPTDVALARDGTLFVADGYADRVHVFSPDGRFLRKWGGPFAMNVYGPFKGWFTTVTSVAIGPQGNVFVADFYNHRIQKFAPDGTFLTAFGEEGSGPGEFDHAIAVDVAEDGTVFAADFLNDRVQVWRPASR